MGQDGKEEAETIFSLISVKDKDKESCFIRRRCLEWKHVLEKVNQCCCCCRLKAGDKLRALPLDTSVVSLCRHAAMEKVFSYL